MSDSLIAVALAGNFAVGAAIVGGLVGAVAMLLVIYGGRATGMTSMDLLRTLGTMMAPTAATSTVYGIGLMIHLTMGAGFGLGHAGLLHAAAPTTNAAVAGFGALFGAIHGAIVTVMMPPMLSMAHPLVRSDHLVRPGVAMVGFGPMTPAGMLMAHIVFGLVSGAVYVALIG